MVPHGLLPPDGSVDVYHSFVKAMDGVRQLREALRASHPAVMAEVCLFQWSRDRLPGSREVLDIFGFHVRIAQVNISIFTYKLSEYCRATSLLLYHRSIVFV